MEKVIKKVWSALISRTRAKWGHRACLGWFQGHPAAAVD